MSVPGLLPVRVDLDKRVNKPVSVPRVFFSFYFFSCSGLGHLVQKDAALSSSCPLKPMYTLHRFADQLTLSDVNHERSGVCWMSGCVHNTSTNR